MGATGASRAMGRLVAAAACLAVAAAARGSPLTQQQSHLQSMSTSPRPLSTSVPLVPGGADAARVDLAAAPPPPCPDAASSATPLAKLRRAIKTGQQNQQSVKCDAYIVFYTDEHLTEEPAADERRLQYVSGWDGAGAAAVLAGGGAAVWVPSGDVRRARLSLTCAWLVIDADDPSQPTIAEWIAEGVSRSGCVLADSRLAAISEWQGLSSALQREGLSLVHAPGLLDSLWAQETDPHLQRPPYSRIVARQHDPQYTGLSWREKVSLLRTELRAVSADAMVITALDEVAWLLNVRGRDVPHAPLLKAFVVVTAREVRVYAPRGKLTLPIREALGVSLYGCGPGLGNCTSVHDYEEIYSDLRASAEWSKILVPTASTFQRGASAAVAQSVPPAKRLLQMSPVIYLKAQKNAREADGMRKAHLLDAVAMCTLLSYLEKTVKGGLSELSVAAKVDGTRQTQGSFAGLAMRTRAAFGPSGAEPDYAPTERTSRRVFTNSTLVIHSGGQYREGTTVVARTLHYGAPTRAERLAYTAVLRAAAALASLRAPAELPAAHVDPLARAPLWAHAQNYPHPTGHGVGAALNRREDPVVLDYRQDTNLHTLREGYFITSEPAWFEPGRFGVRLGSVLEVVQRPDGYLALSEATLVPYEPKLIERSLLTDYEITWLNGYNSRIRGVVGPELRSQGLTEAYYWMMNKTQPLPVGDCRRPRTSAAAAPAAAALALAAAVVACFV